MITFSKYRKILLITAFTVTSIFLLTQCMQNKKEKTAQAPLVRFEAFAGSETCAGCHRKIYETHIHTAHYLTTRPAVQEFIKGSFDKGKNAYAYDSTFVIVMEKRDSGFYQVGYFHGAERIAKRFDIVVGSGSKGQTFITRFGNRLYQLPVSYFTAANSWANSPQFPRHPVVFNRGITSRCLECHSTFVTKFATNRDAQEEFNFNQIIYGVDCEKCHGPAAKHVEFQSQNPTETKAKYIINPKNFSRQQMLDLCALCHGGRLRKTKPSFQFQPGDTLSNFFDIDSSTVLPENIDVHGNQFGLLRASKCFRMSGMTCVSCHNPHENERGKIALFSERCMNCHNGQQAHMCKLTDSIGYAISKNCIDCHMPLQASHSITELLPGKQEPTAAMIRSHYIAIYPNESKNFSSFNNPANSKKTN
ncbi:MAG: hypothetical protein C5B59_10850 [Bacteroidetes bacterium]|nr:MAG: hypothetical protein C5B59_10850 [Bacteroidota bacterium]